jgi:hypothetical protein
MTTYPTQHLHFSYTHLLNVLSFYSLTFYAIHQHGFNHHPVEFAFYFIWDILIAENTKLLSPFYHFSSYFMTNIFINLSITQQHRSLISKCIIHEYYLSVQTNIFIIWVVPAELTLYIFSFSPTKSKTFKMVLVRCLLLDRHLSALLFLLYLFWISK